MMMWPPAGIFKLLMGVFLLLSLTACDREPANRDNSIYREIEVWAHYGNETQRRAIQDQVVRFNTRQDQVRVNVVILPQGAYEDNITTAATRQKLPDILEVDPTHLFQFAESGLVIPLDKLLTDSTRNDMLAQALDQDMYHGRIYGISPTVSSLVLLANQRLFRQAGLDREMLKNWSLDDFDRALKRLSAVDDNGAVFDMQLYRRDGWAARVLQPWLVSAGGGLLIDGGNDAYQSGLLRRQSLDLLSRIQRWQQHGYLVTDKDEFTRADAALLLTEHPNFWQYYASLGDDLVIAPLPHGTGGTRTMLSSWSWSMTRQCRDKQAAIRFLEFLFRTDEVVSYASATGEMPATHQALQMMEEYTGEGHLTPVVAELDHALKPAQFSALPMLMQVLQPALQQILQGEDVRTVMKKANASTEKILASYQTRQQGRL